MKDTTQEPLAPASDTAPRRKSGGNWLLLTLPVALIAAFAELGYAIINNSVLQVYLVKGLGIDPAVMSMVLLPFFISEVLFKGPLGVLADSWGRKPLMVIGPALSIVTPIIMVAVPYPYGHHSLILLCVFGLLRLIDGLGAAALWPAMFAYIGDVVEHSKRASAMSLLNVTYIMGLALGFLAGGWVNDNFGPILTGSASVHHQIFVIGEHLRISLHPHAHSVAGVPHPTGASMPDGTIVPRAHFYPSFYLASVLFALSTIVAVVALKNRVKAKADASEATTGEGDCHEGKVSWESFVEALQTIPGMLVLAFVAFLGIGCIAPYVKLLAWDEFGLKETDFGLLILYPAPFIALAAVPLGHLADKFGKVLAVRFGFVLCALGMWTLVGLYHYMILAANIPHHRELAVVVGGSFVGLGFVVAFPAWMALLTSICSEEKRGTVIGAVSTAQGLGVAVGLPIGGWLYKHYSDNPHVSHISPFFVSAVLLAVSVVLSFILMKPAMEKQTPAAAT